MMKGLASSYKLYAWCDRGREIAEDLLTHLTEVAGCAKRCAEALGLDKNAIEASCIAGLLHDVGKAVRAYQEKCTFPGHEIVSSAIAIEILNNIDMGSFYRSSILYAIALHHQALRSLKKALDDTKYLGANIKVYEIWEELSEKAKEVCDMQFPNIKIELLEIKDLYNVLGKLRFGALVENKPPNEAFKGLGIVRAISGCVIICDNHVAYRNRGGVSALGKAASWFYTWIQRHIGR